MGELARLLQWWIMLGYWFGLVLGVAFSAIMLMVGWQKQHLYCKTLFHQS